MTRDIRLTLSNGSDIPLVGNGKTVKLAFYEDMNHEEQIGDIITIDPSAYQDIDNNIYTYTQTLNVKDFIGNAQEVPEEGIRIYATNENRKHSRILKNSNMMSGASVR